jgi:hypothetical protein
MVGEEVVKLPRLTNVLPEGAGENDALKANGYFEQPPHHVRGGLHASTP